MWMKALVFAVALGSVPGLALADARNDAKEQVKFGIAVAPQPPLPRFIEDTSGDAVLVEEGSLYPALYRLERRGWVEAEWGTSELGRRAKLYRLTDAGRQQLEAEMATWRRFSTGVSKVLLST